MQRLNKTAEQTAKILKAFAKENKEWGISELAKHLGYAKSSIHGIVQALVHENILEKNKINNKYKCGFLLMQLGLQALTELELIKLGREALYSLNEITGETVFLTMCMEGKIRVIGVRESVKPLRLSISIGSEMPLDRGACGKIWYAYLSDDEKDRIKKDGKIDTSIVEKSVGFVLKNGYAVSIEEVFDDITAIAAPIVNRENKLEGIIVVGGLSAHFTEEKIKEYGKIIKSECKNISMQLSHA